MAFPDAYDTALLALSPNAYWPCDDPSAGTDVSGSKYIREASGSWLSDHNLWVPWDGTHGTLAATSILPGASGTCLHKTGTGPMAVSFAGLSTGQKAAAAPAGPVSFSCWFQPDNLNGGSNTGLGFFYGQFAGFNVKISYQSIVVAGIGGPGSRLAVPGAALMVTFTYDRGTGNTTHLYVNGVSQGTPQSQSGAITANTNNVEFGGSFGTSAFQGYLQKIALFPAALTVAQIQSLYVIGAASITEQAGASLNVYPFSRQAIGANPARKTITLTNDSDTPQYLSLSDTSTPAVASSGIRLNANGGSWSSATWKGAVQVIHPAPVGSKSLLIQET